MDGPFAGQNCHDLSVDPFAVPLERLPLGALPHEADLLVDAHGARVECVDLQFHTVHADGVEGVREDQSGSLSAVTAPEDSRPDQGDPEHAGTVVGIQVVQDHLADVFTRGLVDYRQIELVVFARAGTSTGIRRDTYLIGYT